MRRVVSALVFLAAFMAAFSAQASGGLRVSVLVPERGNMQYASFWIALGADYFADEGYDVELVVPKAPGEVGIAWQLAHPDFAVLPAAALTNALIAHADISLLANLFMNDPTALVVRRSKAPLDGPIPDRLAALRGVKLGVAPYPLGRLHALYAAFGLDADADARIVMIAGNDQGGALHDGTVDALFTSSPYLERAIAEDDAVPIVVPAAGQVPTLAKHVAVAFATRAVILDRQRPVAVGLVRALIRAAHLIHESPNEAVTILATMFPDRDRRALEAIVRLYTPAIPIGPGFPWQELPATAALYADGSPDLSRVDLTHVVNYDVMAMAEEKVPPGHARRVMLAAGAILLGIAILGVLTKASPRWGRAKR